MGTKKQSRNLLSETKTFKTIAERDAFINKHFPERECTDIPRFYKIEGGTIDVASTELSILIENSKEKMSANWKSNFKSIIIINNQKQQSWKHRKQQTQRKLGRTR
ncbi:hypothetical protein COB64_03995 [Candidatus Wolfebacteria bacterium]|nr:MAG: hypothetical protein COB64_03995 [Candidatus Wolfebacteria bacterium]